MNPLLLVDFYKPHHNPMYPDGMTKLNSNLTPRKSRMKGVDKVVVFAIQHLCKTYLIDAFDKEFFNVPWSKIRDEYYEEIKIDLSHIERLHELGYLPIEIKALPEGSRCPIGVPLLTITNTHPEFAWLVNYLETLISCTLWQPITSATIAYEYKKLLTKYAIETTGNADGVQWQGHDFSMRGMSSVESSILSGMGHLLSFTGTDVIPAIYQLKKSYNAAGLIGASVPASEHSVECMGGEGNEKDSILKAFRLYKTGIISKVMDTWDITKVAKPESDGVLFQIKNEIMSRDGKLVIRPDSCPNKRTPADIICGHDDELTEREKQAYYPEFYKKGLVECLWEIFGGTINDKGYKVLDSHIGGIYGDSITLVLADEICARLKAKGFASTNIVLGIGSMTYTGGETSPGNQYWITRDLFGFAVKATYGEVLEPVSVVASADGAVHNQMVSVGREIFKDPITDDGTKKSAKGLLRVNEILNADSLGKLHHSTYQLKDQCTKEEEQGGALRTVFKDSKMIIEETLDMIRQRLAK